jgi:hypothetical protein
VQRHMPSHQPIPHIRWRPVTYDVGHDFFLPPLYVECCVAWNSSIRVYNKKDFQKKRMSLNVYFSGWESLRPGEFAVHDGAASEADLLLGPWSLQGVHIGSEPCMQWLLRETGQAEPVCPGATAYVLTDDVKKRWRRELDTWGKVSTGIVVYSRDGPATLRGPAPIVEVSCPALDRVLRLADRRGEHIHLTLVADQEKEQPDLDGVLADTDNYRTCSAAMAGPHGCTVSDVPMPDNLLFLHFLAPFTPGPRVKYADARYQGVYLSMPVMLELTRRLQAAGQLQIGPLVYAATGILAIAE